MISLRRSALALFFLAAEPARGSNALHTTWEITVMGPNAAQTTTQLGLAGGSIAMPAGVWSCKYNQAVEYAPHVHTRYLTCTDGIGVAEIAQSCADDVRDKSEGLLFLSYLGARRSSSVSLKCVSAP